MDAHMKSYTDLEQSKRLAGILPIESADMSYSFNFNSGTHEISTASYKSWVVPKYAQPDDGFGKLIPCWYLAALFCALPLVDFTMPQLIGTLKTLYRCMYNDDLKSHAYDNPIDACVEMILKLNKLKLL